MPRLTYLVLRCADLEASRRFYEVLGFTVTPEQHGTGPQHHACRAGDVVLELYALGAEKSTGARLGLVVEDVEHAIFAVREAGGAIVRAGVDEAVLRDPDGHTLHLMRAERADADLG
ncbi:Hypothetical protein A7982_06419 [Minicystis rosea]|nr:Hypothetical protein A7982_06419 [Minicystis rosea]